MSKSNERSPESEDLVISATDDTDLRQQLVSLRTENFRLRQKIISQEKRIKDLEKRLKQYENPHTPSSKKGGAGDSLDPSNDDEDEEIAGGDSDAASDKSPGRNPGHEGTTRTPPDPDKTIRVEEAHCHSCDNTLTEPDRYISRTIIDTPLPIPTTVVEYKLGKHNCTCGNEVVAEHPNCPKKGRFGPNILAQTVLRRYHGRLPNRKQTEFFNWQFDCPVTHRTVYNMTERVADRLRPEYEKVKEKIRESDVVYCDETGLSVDGDQNWIWTFVTDDEVLYKIDESRGSKVLEEVLGDDLAEDSTLSCDGWSAYPSYHTKLQRCWAHLLREADYVAERYEEAEEISEKLHDLHKDLKEFDEKDPSASAREEKRAEASLYLEGLTRNEYETDEVKKLVEKIRNGHGSWLTFVTEPGVDSTNNRAERALREQVVMRKIFGCLRSSEGVHIHETITTMLATWQRRGLDPPEQLKSILGGQPVEHR